MEIEKKFLLDALPDIPPKKHIEIYQGYVSTSPEVRIRSYREIDGDDAGHTDYKMTVKGDGDLSREEIETYISGDFFDKVAKFIGKPLIHKDYRSYILGGHVLECSIVDKGTPNEFIYGEVEFETEEQAMAYEWPFNGAVDVTSDQQYKMKNYWNRTRVRGGFPRSDLLRFILDGCDISFCAEAPGDITLAELLEQCDKIFPDWCACGICSYERGNAPPETEPEIIIDYKSIRKANEDVSCSIREDWNA